MKIICIGRNYVDHISELKNEVPTEPVVFLKPNTALHFYGDRWYIPEFSNNIHYECEIVLKISKNGKYIQPALASNYFEEISLGIDFTARDIQNQLKEKGLPWEKAKAFDRSALVGKFIPKNSVKIDDIAFSMTQNGNIVQQASSNQMIYNFEQIISEVSRFFTLHVGDLIYTGTPAGVGQVIKNDKFVGKIDDVVIFRLEVGE